SHGVAVIVKASAAAADNTPVAGADYGRISFQSSACSATALIYSGGGDGRRRVKSDLDLRGRCRTDSKVSRHGPLQHVGGVCCAVKSCVRVCCINKTSADRAIDDRPNPVS